MVDDYERMITRLITNPPGFVERQSKYPGIRTQSIIAIIVGFAFGLQHLGNIAILGSELQYVTGPIWVLALANVLIAFALWTGITIIIYFIARIFGGYFSIDLLFQLVGWGLTPLIFGGALRSLGMLYVLNDAEPPAEPGFSSFQNEYDVYQSYLETVTAEPVFLASVACAIPFVLFSGYIWALVVESISDVNLREAMIVSVIPTLLCLVWLTSPILF